MYIYLQNLKYHSHLNKYLFNNSNDIKKPVSNEQHYSFYNYYFQEHIEFKFNFKKKEKNENE